MVQRSGESDVNEPMAHAFALALKESGLTESEFADALSLSHDQVNRYKRNATTLPASVLYRAATLVKRTMDELVAMASGVQPGKSQAERLRELEEISEQQQQAIQRLLDGQQRLAKMLDGRATENV